jgi:aquaporin Z
MEVIDGHNNRVKVCLIEMIGTGMLVLAINFGSKSGSSLVLFQAEAISLTLFLLEFSLGPISGGHFNPAVTVAVLIKEGKKNYAKNFGYAVQIILSQLLGALGGCLLTLLGLTYS